MKKARAAAGIVLLVAAVFMLCSCEKSGARLVGRWERYYRGSSSSGNPTYVISQDGTWSECFRSGYTETKNWSVDKDYTEMTFVYDDGYTVTYSISNLEDDSFTLTLGDSSTDYYRIS